MASVYPPETWTYPKRWSTTQWWDDPNIRGWQRKWVLSSIELEGGNTIKENWAATTQIRKAGAQDPRPLSNVLRVDLAALAAAQQEPEHEAPTASRPAAARTHEDDHRPTAGASDIRRRPAAARTHEDDHRPTRRPRVAT